MAREAAHADRERSVDEVATLPETWVGGAPAASGSIAAEFQRQQERKARKKKKKQQQQQ
jgi:phage head maturation protease